MSKALRGRVNQLADRITNAASIRSSLLHVGFDDSDDIVALLAAHRNAKRELAAVKAIIRLHVCADQKHNSCRDIRAALKEKGIRI